MTVDEKTWYEVFRRDGGKCRYCAMDLLSSFSTFCVATMDHVVSRKAGGNDEPDNLVLCCSGCNGMLSRAEDLKTFQSRKGLIEKNHAEKQAWFSEFRGKIRKGI